MKDYLSIISDSLLFNGLPETQLQDILEIAIEKKILKSENIFFEGEDANGFYLVAEGVVKVFKMSSC